jgi:hypothetical protein
MRHPGRHVRQQQILCASTRSQRHLSPDRPLDIMGARGGSCWLPGLWMCRGHLTALLSPCPPRSPYFFQGLQKALPCSGNVGAKDPRNPIRATQQRYGASPDYPPPSRGGRSQLACHKRREPQSIARPQAERCTNTPMTVSCLCLVCEGGSVSDTVRCLQHAPPPSSAGHHAAIERLGQTEEAIRREPQGDHPEQPGPVGLLHHGHQRSPHPAGL